VKRWMIVIVVLTLILPSSAVWAQAPEGQEYIVKAGDELNKIAAEYLGDPKAYHEIVDATNLKTEEDISYAPIGNPDVIEVGQKLWIPVSAGTTTEPDRAHRISHDRSETRRHGDRNRGDLLCA